MDFIKNFLRKYSALVLPGALLLVAVILIAVSFLLNSGVKKEMETSVKLARSVSSQLSRTPSERQADIEKSYQERHKADADRIEALVKNTTYRELVNYKVFPEPKDSSRQIFKDFGEDYRSAIQELVVKMDAGDAPSQKELEAAKSIGGTNRSRSSRNDEVDPIIDALCRKKAQLTPVYANPDIFKWYELWDDYDFVGQIDAVKDCWYSQVAYWVYSDVVDTIANMNESSKAISTSPVKRLVGISFTSSANSQGTSTKASGLDTPAYVTEELPPILGSEAWTNRVGDETIDVIHFSISVILEANQVPDFMKELCSEKTHKFFGWNGQGQERDFLHNQITILNSKITPVVRDDQENQYYRYGEESIVQWTATCEYVFVREAYDEIKPDSIKELLGQAENTNSY